MFLLVAFLIAFVFQSAAVAQESNQDASSAPKQDVPPGRDRGKDIALVLPLVRNCIYENWDKTTRPAPNNPVVSIRLHFNRDGTLGSKPTILKPVPTSNFSRLVDTALRAIHKCLPLKNMPPETYYVWQDVVFHFTTGGPAAYAHRADLHLALGQFDRAIADYSKAIEMAPREASYYNYRAWAYFKAGKAAKGLPDAKKALELQPNYARALDTRASIFEALGRREEAIADFRRALTIGTDDPEVQASGKEALKRLGASQ
jgi:tetratricopeptide (TPR) repeat protein